MKFVIEYKGRLIKCNSYSEAFDALGFGMVEEEYTSSFITDYTHHIFITGCPEVKNSYLQGGTGGMNIEEIKYDVISRACTVYKNKSHL